MSRVSKVRFVSYRRSVFSALDLIDAADRLPQDGLIIIKPNLTNSSPFPVTTPFEAVEAVHEYCRLHTKAEVIIGEGAGSGTTADVFDALGYGRLAGTLDIELVDFNTEKTVLLKNEGAFHLKEFRMPEILTGAFVISLPVLKDHCFTVTTVSMKNMFGIAPAPFYGGTWNKSKLHSPSTHRSVVDVCLYKNPSLSVIDASKALSGGHLSGRHVDCGLILASFDPVAADSAGSALLGHDPNTIEYLVRSHGRLGSMKDVEIVTDRG
jgi:uncharacterized protein (DUF362 family)